MKKLQQELPFRRWGGARRGAGRKRISPRQNVPHRVRRRFRKGALHVTVRIRREVWNLRTHRCFRALRRAFERGCRRFGFRLVCSQKGAVKPYQLGRIHTRSAIRALVELAADDLGTSGGEDLKCDLLKESRRAKAGAT